MPSGNRLKKRAHTRHLNTGEPYILAKAALRDSSDRVLIPSAYGAQALIESKVMAYLSSSGYGSLGFPLRISGVRLSASQTVVVLHANGVPNIRKKRTFGRLILKAILPRLETGIRSEGGFHGIAGLRVISVEGMDLHLGLVGTNGHVIIRLPNQPYQWTDELARYHQTLTCDGSMPLWEESSQSKTERWAEKFYRNRRHEQSLAWLGSGLLRRIALFRTSTSAVSSSLMIRANEWELRLDAGIDRPLNHDRFLAMLTHRDYGLPLRVQHEHCECDRPSRRKPEAGASAVCCYRLAHNEANIPGELAFTFYSAGDNYARLVCGKLEELGFGGPKVANVAPGARLAVRQG